MTDELDNFDLFKGSSEDKEDDLLGELDSLKGLLSDQAEPQAAEDIPLLDDVVAHPDETSADAQGLKAAMAAAPNPFIPTSPAPRPAPLVQERELEMMVDKLIDRQMPRIRLELKQVLISELRLRGVLK